MFNDTIRSYRSNYDITTTPFDLGTYQEISRDSYLIIDQNVATLHPKFVDSFKGKSIFSMVAEEQNKALRQQNLQKDVQGLRDKYGADISEQDLYAHALRNNIGNLEAAYTHMTYETMQDKARTADIVEEKRAVSSIQDAYRLALEEK